MKSTVRFVTTFTCILMLGISNIYSQAEYQRKSDDGEKISNELFSKKARMESKCTLSVVLKKPSVANRITAAIIAVKGSNIFRAKK